jgi:reverse gyrase
MDDHFDSVYASTCSVCGTKYFGNGYNETKLPCHACLKKQQAALISKSQWYLVKKDREMKPWAFYVLMLTFKTATLADVYAELNQLHGYHPTHGYAIIQHQDDVAVGLAQIIYIEVATSKAVK